MKSKKNILILALLISILMVIGVVPVLNVSAYYTFEDDFSYVRSGSEIEITKCITGKADVVIPEEINGYPVTKINDLDFMGCDTMVNLP